MHRAGLVELQAVMAVAQRGSFRAAAKALGMSTSAVSAAVAGLERRLGVRLFHRTTRSVALTEAGQRYVARVGPALAEIERAGDEVLSQPGAPSGTLRINAPREAVGMLIEPLLANYLRRYPQMRLEIAAEPRLVDIVAEGFDAGIRLAEAVPQDMVAVALTGPMRLLMVASPAYLAEYGTPSHPRQLDGHQAIRGRFSHGGIYRWELEHAGEALEVDLPARLILGEMSAIRQAACAGLGLAFLSEWHIAEDLASGRLLPVLPEWCPRFEGMQLYYPGHRQVPPGLQALVAMARELRLS